MPRDYVKMYAPYVFLAKGATEISEYDIFVCVPHKSGQRVVHTPLPAEKMYSNGKTFLEFRIEGKGVGKAGNDRFFKRISLDPDKIAQSNGYTFDDTRFCVEVTTKRQQNAATPMQTIQVFYRDTYDDALPAEQIAFDSPYLYLINPNEGTGNQIYEYAPYCLVPLKDFGQGESLKQNYVEDETTGECQQEIVLSLLSPEEPAVGSAADVAGVEATDVDNYREILLRDIEVNSQVYKDMQKTQGWFEVTVSYPAVDAVRAPVPKRKGRLTNASSDPNPTSFIDSFF